MNANNGVEPAVWTKTVEPFMFGSPNRPLFGRSYKKIWTKAGIKWIIIAMKILTEIADFLERRISYFGLIS